MSQSGNRDGPRGADGQKFVPAAGSGITTGQGVSRKVFQIGFNKCGTTLIARLFQMNGYPAVHGAKGALAEDIA